MALWFGVISDLFINLSAGWFGAAIISSFASKKPKFKPWALILNFLAGIVALVLAVVLRSLI